MKISKKNSGRIIASLIFLTPIIVLITSSAMFYSGYTPEGKVNKGTLLPEPIQLSDLAPKSRFGAASKRISWEVVGSPVCFRRLH